MQRGYNDVVSRIEALRSKHMHVEVLDEIAGSPVYRVSLSTDTALPTILFNAGTHGDEPAGVESALQFLEGDPGEWLDHFQFEVIPCLNPHGYVNNQRENHQGIDINWAYQNDDVQEIELIKQHIIGRKFETILDLHEDWESPGFYLYEQVRGLFPAGPEMARRVSKVCPVNPHPIIEGEIAKNGVIFPDLEIAKRRKGSGVPIVIYDQGVTDRLITTETPTAEPLEVRVQANLIAIETLLKAHQ
jgi:hypothetical protein